MALLDDLAAQQAATDPNAPGAVRPLAPPAQPNPTPPPDITGKPVKTAAVQGNNELPFWPDQQEPPSIFIPASANRAPREWKDPPWNVQAQLNNPSFSSGPYGITPWETYGVLHGTGSSMSRWGSPAVQMHASQVGSLAGGFAPLLDLISSGKFSQNFNAAQTRRLQNQMIQMNINAQMAERAHRQQSEIYGNILEEGALGAITPQEAEMRLGEYARSQGDNTLLEILHNKGLGAATRFLQWRDAQMNDMLTASTSLKRATGMKNDAELDEEWGVTPGASGGTGGRFPMIPGTDIAAPAATPGRPAPPPVAQADPTATASSAVTDADTPPSDDDANKFFEDLKKGDPSQGRPVVSEQQLDMAKQMLDGPPPDSYKDLSKQGTEGHRIKAGIDSAYSALRGKLGMIASDPRYKTNQQKLDAMAKYAPAQAARLGGFLSYDTDLDKEGIKTRDQDRAMLLRLNPHWNENGFRIKQEWNKQNQPSAQTMGRANSLVQAQEDLSRSLLQMPLDRPNLIRDVDAVLANKWTGDPRFADVVTNIQNVVTDTISIQTGGARPAVSLVNQRIHNMFATQSPSQILVQLQDDSRAAYAKVVGYNYTFQSAINDPTAFAPGFNRLTDDRYKSFILMNPYTQTMPADAPPSALAGSRPIGSEKVGGYVRKGIDDYQPLRLADVDQARKFVNDPQYRDSKDPKVQAQIAHLRKLLGPLADPDPWNYVGPR